MAFSINVTSGSWIKTGFSEAKRRNGVRVSCSSASLGDHYRTLRIRPGASEKEVKKAFRQLALQYHPDVCKENNCRVQFHEINEAYEVVMRSLKATSSYGPYSRDSYGTCSKDYGPYSRDSYGPYSRDSCDDYEPMWGRCEPNWDLWEEWMGWEGAGITDYSSHINPYI